MYRNFNLSDEERQQIMEMHKSHGYKQPIDEGWKGFWNGVKKAMDYVNYLEYGPTTPSSPAPAATTTPAATAPAATAPAATAPATTAPATTAPAATKNNNEIKTKQATSLSDVVNGSYIYQGMSGNAVKELQSALNSLGDPEFKVDVDGSYGPQTMAAVTKLQQKLGVKPSGKYGIFGPKTLKAMADMGSNQHQTPNNQQTNDNPETLGLDTL